MQSGWERIITETVDLPAASTVADICAKGGRAICRVFQDEKYVVLPGVNFRSMQSLTLDSIFGDI